MNPNRSRFTICGFFILVAATGAAPLRAQEAPESQARLEEVVVFDEPIDEFAREGVAVGLLDGEDLSLWNADTPRDIPQRVPNFFTTDTGTQGFGDVMVMRGLGSTPFFSNPSVIYYVDGVALGDVFTYADSLYDVESIEVYRGPQGARFGRNAYGGAVNVRTKVPENEFGGSFGITAGEYDRFGVNGSVSGALVDDVLKFRLHGFHSERDGFLDNITLGISPDNESRSGGGGTLYWTPDDDWEIALSGGWEVFDNGTSRLVPLRGFEVVTSNIEGQMQGQARTAALRVSYDGDDFRFDSVSAWRDWKVDPYVQDIDLSPIPIAFTQIRQEQDQWSQEIRFSSPEDDGGGFHWTAGVYGAATETDHNGFNSLTGITTYKLDQNDYAVFAEGGIDVSDTLRAILGLRYDYVEKDMTRNNSVLAGGVASSLSNDWDFVSPSFTLELDAAENVLLYASTSYTSKPGGFSAFANSGTPGLAEFDSEENWANEIGLKATAMDGRLRARAAGFYYDIEDYQVERPVANAFGDYVILNAAEASSYGAEIEVEYELLPGLVLDGSIGLTHTELDRFTDPVSGAVLDGNRAPYVPEYDFVLGGTWQAENGLFCRIEYRGVGDTYFDDFNTPRFVQGAYGVLNARVGYRKDRFTVSVFATNLTDQDFYTNINPSIPVVFAPPAVGAGTPGEPRQVGVMATIEF